MKIERVETIVLDVTIKGDWLLVLLHTDEGLVGVGEASQSFDDDLLMTWVEGRARSLVGRDPFRINAIWRELNHPQQGRVERTASSAIEQALWDLVGQALGVPVHTLLGGAVRDRLFLYANINRHVVDRSPKGFARAAEAAAKQGFKAIKIAPFDELDQWDRVKTGGMAPWRQGVERLRAVRDAVGPDIELAADCHNRLESGEALLVADALAQLDLFWFEEPVADQFHQQLTRVAARTPMPTASGENLFGVEGFRNLILDRAVDVIMPDVKHVGGIGELCHVAEAARLNQIMVSPHNPSGPVSLAATAQAAATFSNFYRLEYAWGEVDWRADLLDPPEQIKDGFLILSGEPGLGHRLNPDVAAAYRKKG